MAKMDLQHFIPKINRWYWMEIQDVDSPEIRYNFIGKLVREESGYEIYLDQDGGVYFVLNEIGESEHSELQLWIKTSRVFAGASMAGLRENKDFQEFWTEIQEVAGKKPEWPPKILRDLP
jgi:hypothetical protein